MRKRKYTYNEADKLTEAKLKELGEQLGGSFGEIDLDGIGELDLDNMDGLFDDDFKEIDEAINKLMGDL